MFWVMKPTLCESGHVSFGGGLFLKPCKIGKKVSLQQKERLRIVPGDL